MLRLSLQNCKDRNGTMNRTVRPKPCKLLPLFFSRVTISLDFPAPNFLNLVKELGKKLDRIAFFLG
ncbi:unnamed protein product [Tetraodon nigroviridis]|uniref:(spotted green pufferfish) hypothetical protein n=1 Tax=Tetraodon nigroviridis TaxID=99883 RepID=Q4RIH8_TETNG|nr:unnamed protein product [Tetraodon nigroviridis]